MKMASEQRRIYKINSKFLKKHKWDLTLPLNDAMRNYPDLIVALADSQIMRWLDQLNGIADANAEIKSIKAAIGREKGKKNNNTTHTKNKIRNLYSKLYDLQFQKDYVAVIMDSVKDYDRANKGFKINGITYRRLFGTTNGVKNRTIVYINADIYDEIKKRIDNGRNLDIPLVPGKLEAYQALVASGSTPIPKPSGVIVVNDCITHFKEDIIKISDETDGEPILTYENGVDIEHNDSDGFGLMLPSYSAKVNKYLTGSDTPISGMNTRYAWNKGMLYTFDFVEFAEKIAGKYEIVDVWGNVRDIRNAEVILTASQLKLWDSYENWEDYQKHCLENGYQFSTTKITPHTLESVRELNYQFVNPYSFNDEDLQELCKPTVDIINDILGGDYRKSIVYLAGINLTETNVAKMNDDFVKALCIMPDLVKDPYIKHSIYNQLKKKINDAKKGTITVNGNYLMVAGDPFALAQSMFNLPVTGILKAGEVYQKYWIDRKAKELVCYRAPMTCYNNIRKMKLCNSSDALHWYQYITTALIFNAWDSASDAMNGMDKDGDTNLITDNPVLLANTENAKTIFCLQKKAEKKLVTEDDLIACNKIAFNDDIGAITNRATAMFDIKSMFPVDSPEYKTLEYRIMCSQHFQQCSIDRIKGVVSLPMPQYWYQYSKDMTDENKAIVAPKKPYFMIYRYPDLKAEYTQYVKDSNSNAIRRFRKSIDELSAMDNPPDDVKIFLENYFAKLPVSMNDCTVNRICRIFENEFDGMKFTSDNNETFDYSVLKSGVAYSVQMAKQVKTIWEEYQARVAAFKQIAKETALDKDTVDIEKQQMKNYFIYQCDCVCPDARVLCDIVIDLCYTSNCSKAFAWDICGTQIIKNLLERNNNTMVYPSLVDDDTEGDFEFLGNHFKMKGLEL